MNKKLRIAIFTLMAFLSMNIIYAQTKNLFYASVEDYKNEKPMEGYSIVKDSWRHILGAGTILKVLTGNVEEKKKLKELPSIYFTYNNWFIRVWDNEMYIVIVEGSLCYYAAYAANNVQYLSETITGELIKFSEKTFNKYLKKYDLLDNYEKDKPKREFKDDVNDYFNRTVERNKKYVVLINEKIEGK